MLVEKKSWKNLIKPGIITIMEIIAIVSLVKIGLFILDYDLGKYAFFEIPIFVALSFIIVKIGFEKIDFDVKNKLKE